jgi:hypothetical protein
LASIDEAEVVELTVAVLSTWAITEAIRVAMAVTPYNVKRIAFWLLTIRFKARGGLELMMSGQRRAVYRCR